MTDQQTSALVDAIVAGWRRAGLPLEPVNRSEIEAFERRYEVALPSDFAAFYREVGGMSDDVYDDNEIRFWSLDQVRPAAEELEVVDRNLYADYFVFADYSLWAHGYAIRMSSVAPDSVAVVGGDAPIVVADSFRAFLYDYLHRPASLFLPSK